MFQRISFILTIALLLLLTTGDAIVLDPSNPSTLNCVAGELYKSTDAATSWTQLVVDEGNPWASTTATSDRSWSRSGRFG